MACNQAIAIDYSIIDLLKIAQICKVFSIYMQKFEINTIKHYTILIRTLFCQRSFPLSEATKDITSLFQRKKTTISNTQTSCTNIANILIPQL